MADRATYDGTWENNLFNFFMKVSPKLTEDLKKPFVLKNMQREDDPPLYKAIREAFVNLIIHSDYCMDAGVLKIIKKDDGFIFTNPGRLNLTTKETVAGCAMVVYLNNVGKGQAVELMDKVVDVRVIALNPEERSSIPMDSNIYCNELRKLLMTSLNYTGAIMDGGWLHSEEQEAESLRNSVMGWMGNFDVEDVVLNMSSDFAEFLVRLSQWVRER